MPIDTTWTAPSSLARGSAQTFPYAYYEDLVSNVNRLGGSDGNTKLGTVYIDEETADDDIVRFLSTGDVAHGATDIKPTAVFGAFGKIGGPTGGLFIHGIAESAANTGLHIRSIAGADATTHDTTAAAYLVVDCAKISGTNVTAPGANANLFAVRGNGTNMFLVDQEGDLHVNGSTSLTAFDGRDDLGLVEGARLLMMGRRPEGYRADLARNLNEARDALVGAGVLSLNPDGSLAMVSVKGLLALVMDTVRQEGYRLRDLETRVAPLLGARP